MAVEIDAREPGAPSPVDLPAGVAAEDWTGDARFFEYTQAADPIRSGHTSRVPIVSFPASLHAAATHDATAIIPLDLSTELGIDGGPATSPGLCASFVHVRAGESIDTAPAATSELYYVLRGNGTSTVGDATVVWGAGDVLVLPAGSRSTHRANDDAAFYWVTDEPLLRYLGVTATTPRFRPTMFTAERNEAELQRVAALPGASTRSRVSVLLAGATQPQTLTATHVLWAMYGLLPVDAVQRPHRHQSVALDLIIDCQPGCYSLVGPELDADGNIIDPTRVEWESGGAFVTPPGLWHAHINESGAPARLLPVQDAGLHTYLRSLDIRFVGM
jgi:gentisate 1,2-dioxygenase